MFIAVCESPYTCVFQTDVLKLGLLADIQYSSLIVHQNSIEIHVILMHNK